MTTDTAPLSYSARKVLEAEDALNAAIARQAPAEACAALYRELREATAEHSA